MKKTVFRYGLFSVILIVVCGFLNLKFIRNISYDTQEIIGYITIVLSLVFVFFGIKQYRDKFNNGYISYPKALWLGVLITLFPSVAFGLFDVIYTRYIDPDFVDRMVAQMTQSIQHLPPAEFAAKKKEIDMGKQMMENPVMDFTIMSTTVLGIGVIISALSALVLYRKPKPQFA